MRFLVCPDSFKDSLTSVEVAKIIGDELEHEGHKADLMPIADGGEGTVETLLFGLGGEKRFVKVKGPLGNEVEAFYGLNGDTAYIEMAQSSGLQLLKDDERNPWITTTYGLGELILDALNHKVKRILVGIGGSATNDVGVGMAQALGVKLVGDEGIVKSDGGFLAACDLQKIRSLDISKRDSRIKLTEITVLCDVDNPLTGERGASRVYGLQKGASEEMVEDLEDAVRHLERIFEEQFGKKMDFSGAGAAGGLGAGLQMFCGAKIASGIEVLIEFLKIEEKIKEADMVIVGEGQMDFQTVYGKAPAGITRLAKKYDKLVVAVVGKVGKGYEDNFRMLKLDHIFSCYDEREKVGLETIKKEGKNNVRKLMKDFIKKIQNISSYNNKLTIMS